MILFSPAHRGPAEYFDRRIPNTRLVELTTMRGDFTWLDDESHEATLRAVGSFIEHLTRRTEPDTILSTVLFTDIVGSTKKQAALGDRGWRELVERHHAIVRTQLTRWRGVENDTAGDGFYATFDGPARAIRCATEVAEQVRDLGIEIRAGVHTGECEVIDGKAGGITVSIGARVASSAGPSEVRVSQTVKDLVAGSGLAFEDGGRSRAEGRPGPVAPVPGREPVIQQPETRYARTQDGVSLAYHIAGDGPVDLLWLHAFMGSLEVLWEHEIMRSLTEKLASFTRLIRHDMRATGLSGRATALPNLETQVHDAAAVLDAIGSRSTVITGAGPGAHAALLFGATFPERTRALCLWDLYAWAGNAYTQRTSSSSRGRGAQRLRPPPRWRGSPPR